MEDKVNLWISTLAWTKINEMHESMIKYCDYVRNSNSKERADLVHRYNNDLIAKFNHIKKILKQLNDTVIIEVDDEEVSKSKLIANSLLVLADYAFYVKEFNTAYKYSEEAFTSYNTQSSKYMMAICLHNTNAKTYSLSKKKNAEAVNEHRDKIISLFLEAFKYDPFSDQGIDSGNYLIKAYDYAFSPMDFE